MRFRILTVLLLTTTVLFGQGTYVPLGSYGVYQLDRFEIKSGRLATPQEFSTGTKSYQRDRIATYVDSFDVKGVKLSKQDYFNLDYLQNDNFEFSNSQSTISKWSKFGIYKRKAAFYSVLDDDFKLVVNPVTLLQQGNDRLSGGTLINNRGFEMRGSIGKKIGFYTLFNDEIIKFNSWTREFYNREKVIPGGTFLKSDDGKIYNYPTASGYIVYQPNKYFDIQFGQGKNFLGNGYRSFYVSDFSRDNLFLRVNTRVWKINYTNIWGEILDYVSPSARNKPKRHYYATTQANINIGKNFNLGLFQTIAFQRDTGYASPGYDLQYLNPIIFYKPVENGLNSPDKAILGMDYKWNFLRHFQLYGQVVISEFKIQEMLHNTGWFGNKWAVQSGLKYIDVASVKNLDLQLECNIARPYMYTSFDRLNAYVNYNQNMAHPLGANFYEYIGIVRYQPFNRVNLKAFAMYALYGNDTNGTNFGKDIAKSYQDLYPNNTHGHYISQGIKTGVLTADFVANVMIRHNLFIEFQITYRKATSELAIFRNETIYYGAGIRWNIAERRWDF